MCVVLLLGPGYAAAQTPLQTDFTYQGRLLLAGMVINESADFEFTLWRDAVSVDVNDVVGSTVSIGDVDVVDGYFIVQIDFGANVFDGDARWLEIAVRSPGGGGSYTTLSPRQPITAAPYALQTRGIFVDETTGYVGIGVNPPQRPLHVRDNYGLIRVDRDDQSAAVMMVRYPAGNFENVGKSYTVAVDGLESNGTGKFWIVDHHTDVNGLGDPRLTIDNVGNVGIGTTTPNAKFEVAGVPGVDGIMFPDGTLQTTAGGGIGDGHSLDAADGDPVDALFVDDDGNVGIGTISPTERLDVDGNVRAAGTIVSGNSITIDGLTDEIRSSGSLALHTMSGAALRIVDDPNCPNIIGGHPLNAVAPGILGATISGGGSSNNENRVNQNFCTVGGGRNNEAGGVASNDNDATVAGGRNNFAMGNDSVIGGGVGNIADDIATVSGGAGNSATGLCSTIGGGGPNVASGSDSTVSGGSANGALGAASSIGGGNANTAAGSFSTVPGGRAVVAGGNYSLAAGRRAKVRTAAQSGDSDGDNGTFVWADSTDADFTSTGPDQFLIRASGGVGIGDADPDGMLHVTRDFNPHITFENSGAVGSFRAVSLDFNHSNGKGAEIRAQREGTDADGMYLSFATQPLGGSITDRMRITQSGNVGVGTSDPDAKLHVSDATGLPVAVHRLLEGVLVRFDTGVLENVGSISVSSGTVSYNAFTGSHYAYTDEHIQPGSLVAMSGRHKRIGDDQRSEPVYEIRATSIPNDPRCIGAYTGRLDSAQQAGIDNPDLVAAVGNGELWVVDTGADIGAGDCLIAADVSGHAMLDDPSRFDVGYIVARAAEPVDWSTVTAAGDGRKHKRISVFFDRFVRDTSANAEVKLLKNRIETLRDENSALAARLARVEALLDASNSDQDSDQTVAIGGVR